MEFGVFFDSVWLAVSLELFPFGALNSFNTIDTLTFSCTPFETGLELSALDSHLLAYLFFPFFVSSFLPTFLPFFLPFFLPSSIPSFLLIFFPSLSNGA